MARLLGGMIGAALALWLLWAFQYPIVVRSGYAWQSDVLGQWGDTFGALNALFAALGFSAVLITIWLQQRQIRAAQDEQHRQRFEGSYFELLRLLREARNDVRFRHGDEYRAVHPKAAEERRNGVDAFISAWREACRFMRGKNCNRNDVGRIYDEHIHKRYENNLGPYFRLLYTILDRIKYDAVLTQEEKHRYGNLLRSQLTSYEIALAGLNGLSLVSKDFGDLVTDFHLLKYLPEGTRRRTLMIYYPQRAFMARD